MQRVIVYVPYPLYCWIWDHAQPPQITERVQIGGRIVAPIMIDDNNTIEYHILPKKKGSK